MNASNALFARVDGRDKVMMINNFAGLTAIQGRDYFIAIFRMVCSVNGMFLNQFINMPEAFPAVRSVGTAACGMHVTRSDALGPVFFVQCLFYGFVIKLKAKTNMHGMPLTVPCVLFFLFIIEG